MKLNLGSGDSKIEGFTSVDLYDKEADVQADICYLPYEDNSVEEIVCYQVIEHVPYNKSQQMFEEMYRVLKKGGTAIVETPDIDKICQFILRDGITDQWMFNLVGEYYRPWDKTRYEDWDMCAAAIHRNPWNFSRLSKICEPIGFKLKRRESFPEENMSCLLIK